MMPFWMELLIIVYLWIGAGSLFISRIKHDALAKINAKLNPTTGKPVTMPFFLRALWWTTFYTAVFTLFWPFKVVKRPEWLVLEKELITGCEARGDANSPYLTRYTLIKTEGWKLCYHIFHRSDADDLHDHPWDFLTFPLVGYIDVTAAGAQRVRALVPYYRKAEHQHRVQLRRRFADPDDIEWWGVPLDVVRNTWWDIEARSFVLMFKPRRDWGFIVPKHGWMNWRTYFHWMNC
jgi:hypothetical protein